MFDSVIYVFLRKCGTTPSSPLYNRTMSATPKPWLFERYQPPNITIPLGTLSIAIDEMFDMSGMLDRIQMQMVVTLLSTISVGEQSSFCS